MKLKIKYETDRINISICSQKSFVELSRPDKIKET